MLSNYLKIALRNLVKNKVYSFINIGGLAVGMSVAMLIGLWIYDELSFNKYHKNYDRIAKVMMTSTNPSTGITKENLGLWLPVEDILKNNYGQYFEKIATVWYTGEMTLKVGNNNFTKKGNYLGPDILEMLTLEMIAGDRKSLTDPHAMVISENTAIALFGSSNPINQPIKIDNRIEGVVKGVYKNLPKNTVFGELDFIASFELWKLSNEWVRTGGWNSSSYNFLVQLVPNVSIEQANVGIKDLFLKFGPTETAKDNARYKPAFYLYPMKDWHLYSEFQNGHPIGGRVTFVWMFGLIGVFVLLLACINFMNLSTARSEKRAKEVGIRKAIGSVRVQLILQFFSESYLVIILAFTIALGLILISLKSFGEIADKQIELPVSNIYFWLISILFIALTGLLSGIYPSLYLSSFHPIKILKGTLKVGKYASIPRKVLVVVQFTVSVTLIIGTFVVYKQIIHAQNRPIGYDSSQLLTIPLNDPNYYGKHEVLKSELLNSGFVSNVGFSFSPLTQVWDNIGGFTWEGRAKGQESDFAIQKVDYDLGKTIDWKIIKGRDYSKAFGADSLNLIVNEAAVKYLGFKDPIGKQIIQRDDNTTYTIVGVVKDLIMQSPYEPAKRTFFFLQKKGLANQIHIKLQVGNTANAALPKIEAVFKKIVPSASFNYKFVDEEYNTKFRAEQRIGTLASIFAILAIFISCLGLFGLASFLAEQRTKEIGIRKVLGASVANLWQLLSKDFVILVIISCLIAAPIAYYFMNNWLQKYTYRTEISWWIFVASGIGALLITLLTVSYQAIRAALMNPVKSLKTE